MFNDFDYATIISSYRGKTKLLCDVKNRHSHCFLFRIKGSVEYQFEDKTLTANQGEAIFIPKGTSYRYRVLDVDDNLYTSINFSMDLITPTPKVFSLENFHNLSFIYQNFSKYWTFGANYEKYFCLSVFYDLISYVFRIEHLSNFEKNKFSLIEPAIEYLKNNIFNCDFKTDKLHKLCGISDTYFIKIFKVRFGSLPKDYIIKKRLSHAKAIIEHGDYENIYEVAEAVGFNDSLYFSKAYKKLYGITPTETIK